MADPTYIEIKNLVRANELTTAHILVADDPVGLVTNGISFSDFEREIFKQYKQKYIPTLEGFDIKSASVPNFVKYAYIQFLQKDTNTMLDESRGLFFIPNMYFQEFNNQLGSTDFRIATTTATDDSDWHKLRGDGIGIVNAENRYPRFTSNGALVRTYQGHTLQQHNHQYGYARWGTTQANRGIPNINPMNGGFYTNERTSGVLDASVSGETRPDTIYTVLLVRYKVTTLEL